MGTSGKFNVFKAKERVEAVEQRVTALEQGTGGSLSVTMSELRALIKSKIN